MSLGPRISVDSEALLSGLPPICLFVDFILHMMFVPPGAVAIVLTPQARLWIPKGCHRTSGALVQQIQGWWWYFFQPQNPRENSTTTRDQTKKIGGGTFFRLKPEKHSTTTT